VASGMLSSRLDFAKFIMLCGRGGAMALLRSLRKFGLGGGIFIVAIAVVVFMLSHDLLAFLAVPAVIAVLLVLEAREKLSTKS
jgi:hypothetical protein